MIIETQGSKDWITELRRRYDLKETTMNESDNAFTVLITRGKHHNIIVGRYCRVTGNGVVLDKREKFVEVKYERRKH